MKHDVEIEREDNFCFKSSCPVADQGEALLVVILTKEGRLAKGVWSDKWINMATLNKKNKHTARQQRKKRALRKPNVSSQQSLLQQAMAFHQSGRLPQAEALYRKILQTEPEHPEALALLGMLAHQAGKSNFAVELIRKALNRRPDYVNAYIYLGLVLNDQRKFAEAETSFRKAISLKPDHADALFNLGIVLQAQGRLGEAAESFLQSLNLMPDSADIHYNLGVVQQARGMLDEAASCYGRALNLYPDHADARYNLGVILQARGKLAEAAKCYREVLALQPEYVDACNNLGIILRDQGKVDEAVTSFRRALTLNPDYIEAHYNLGNILFGQEKFDEAASNFRAALVLQPNYAEAHNNLGNVFEVQGQFEEAIACYQRALALQPDYARAHNNMGNVLKAQGQLEEAVACYRRALALQPDFAMAHSNLLLCLNYFPGQSISQYLEEARRFGKTATAKVKVPYSDWSCATEPRRLRVGIVSGDFRNHPVGYFLENMLANLDPASIELVAYPTYGVEDALTRRIRSRFAAWKPLPLKDEDAAKLIHDDDVHVLVDLAGHTAHNRLPLFAWKTAPVQASWLGYFASTGIAEIDYLLADPVSVPEPFRSHFTEEVWYLPETRLCFSPPETGEELAVTSLPATRNNCFTFGCFQDVAKLNDEVLAAWGRILKELPRARLRLQNRSLHAPTVKEQLLQRLAGCGIMPQRVIFGNRVTRSEYLAIHSDVDIILDTFPFPGGTTTCEALWMGVPTVTMTGETMLARQGASLMTSVGLTDWIAADEEDYVAKAVGQASDLEKLARLRADLRRRALASPLFDGPRFARHFEVAMWGMWQRFRAGQ